MRNLNSKFAKIRQQIRKSNNEIALELLLKLQEDVNTKLETLHKTIETKGKKATDVGYRELQVSTVKTNSNKFTANAHSGRFILKIGNKVTEKVRYELIGFCSDIMKVEDLPCVTLRGNIQFKNNEYIWTGYSDSKKFKRTFRSK